MNSGTAPAFRTVSSPSAAPRARPILHAAQGFVRQPGHVPVKRSSRDASSGRPSSTASILEGRVAPPTIPGASRAILAIAGFAAALIAPGARADDLATTAIAPFTETVTVTATRLADQESDVREVPASTTVITRSEIGSSGARTVQDLLARVAGAVMFDQIGNAVQTTLDLRGFTGGGVTVLVDGARVNDPRNNTVPLETILLDAVERVEILRGPAAATVGGGSAAGVVNIVTRRGSESPFAGKVSAAGGSYGTGRAGIDLSGSIPRGSRDGPVGPASIGARRSPGAAERPSAADAPAASPGFDWLLTAFRDRAEGFRENADARLTRVTAAAGYTAANGSRGALTLHSADDEIGAPGALTLQENDEDRGASPFNRLDSSDLSSRQAAFNWRSSAGARASLAAHLSYLSRDSRNLTTGRSAALFGGFILDSGVRTMGGALQSTLRLRTAGLEHALVIGGEELGGTSEAEGCGTSPSALDRCDPTSFLSSHNRTRRTDVALFAQDSVRLGGNVTVLAGGRWDRSRFAYRESVPDAANDQSRTFSETSWKAGVAWNPAAALGLYASYGESFQPPTVEDLFAFPSFGSNPDLRPADARNYEVGLRGILSGRTTSSPRRPAGFSPTLAYALSVFRTNLTNEIVFVSMPTLGNPFNGRNLNAAKSLREGIEATGDWRIYPWLSWSFAYARTQATFENGLNAGNDIPLVPRNRYSESTHLTFPRGVGARIDLIHVGTQVLTSDEANRQRRLDGYLVVDARVTWRARSSPGTSASPPSAGGLGGGGLAMERVGLELFLEGRNLLDEEYATRGIYAPFSGGVFVTPAPGRTVVGGVAVTF